MRILAITCIALTIMLQLGCASMLRMSAKKSKKPDAIAERYMVGRQLESDGHLEGARQVYKELLMKKPDSPEYLHRMAVVSTRLQRYTEAMTLYERAKKLDPKNASLLTDMGYTAHLRGKQKEAEKLLREALKQKPKDLRATSNLALVIGGQGRIDESLELLRTVEDEPTALSSLAYIHVQRGELDLAEQRYRESLNLNPNSVEIQSALAAVVQQRPKHEAAAVVRVSGKAAAEEFADDDSPSPKKRDRSEIQLTAASTQSAKSEVVTADFIEEETDADQPGQVSERVNVAAHVTTNEQTSSTNNDAEWEVETPGEVPTLVEVETPAVEESSTEEDWSDEPVAKPAKQKLSLDRLSTPADSESDASEPEEVKPASQQSEDDEWAAEPVSQPQPRKRHRAKSVAAQLLEIDQEEAPAAAKSGWSED